jgi:transposase
MARKSYSEEFRRQAVELYESTPGATFRGIAADLGITRNTLKDWVVTRGRASTAGTTAGTTAGRNGTTPSSWAVRADSPRQARPRPGSPQAELAVLRARVQALESQNTLLATERDILRQAAKYFAGETRW